MTEGKKRERNPLISNLFSKISAIELSLPRHTHVQPNIYEKKINILVMLQLRTSNTAKVISILIHEKK